MRSKEVEESIEIFESWIDFNKNNKDIVNKADELIKVQENILSYIKTLEQLPNKIRDKISLYKLEIETLKTLYPKTYTRDSDYLICVCKIDVLIEVLKSIIGE